MADLPGAPLSSGEGLILAAALICSAWLGPIEVVGVTTQVDLDGVGRGVTVRLGQASEQWRIEVTDIAAGSVSVRFRPPRGEPFERAISVQAPSQEERTRELAAAIALIVEERTLASTTEPTEQPDAQPQPKAPDAQPTGRTREPVQRAPEPVRGWVAAAPRVGLGPPSALDPDFGLGFVGGVWLVREYLQPVAEIVWSRSVAGALSIDGVRLGLGLAAGAPVYDKRVWIGAEIIPHAMWTRIEDQQTIGTWTSSTEVAARVQYRHGWLYVGGRLGVDLTFPAIRATGENDRMRWGNLRFVAGVEIGVVIPGRKTSR